MRACPVMLSENAVHSGPGCPLQFLTIFSIFNGTKWLRDFRFHPSRMHQLEVPDRHVFFKTRNSSQRKNPSPQNLAMDFRRWLQSRISFGRSLRKVSLKNQRRNDPISLGFLDLCTNPDYFAITKHHGPHHFRN